MFASRRLLSGAFRPSAMLLVEKGKVEKWIADRGFGFISDDNTKKSHFVHFSALKVVEGGFRALNVGQEVEFDIVNQDGKTRAENVTAPGGQELPSGPRPPNQGQGGNFRGGRGGGNFRGGRGRGGPRPTDNDSF